MSDVLSIFTTYNLLPSAVGSLCRDLESGLVGLRTVAMTVVLGRERYFSTKPLPMPGERISGVEEKFGKTHLGGYLC